MISIKLTDEHLLRRYVGASVGFLAGQKCIFKFVVFGGCHDRVGKSIPVVYSSTWLKRVFKTFCVTELLFELCECLDCRVLNSTNCCDSTRHLFHIDRLGGIFFSQRN